MFENPRRGKQARNFTTNVPKILDLISSSEQIFSETCRWVPCIVETRVNTEFWPRVGGRGGGILGLVFGGNVPLASQSPYPKSILWPIIDPISVTFEQIRNFHDPNLVTFYFHELTHFLDWTKNTLLFICSKNILVSWLTVNMKNCLTLENPKMCDPFLVTLSTLQSHYSQSSHENATSSSGTSPLASYKEVHRRES